MFFKCKLYGESSYGKWARGEFLIGNIGVVDTLVNLKTDLVLEKDKTYKVKNFRIYQKKDKSLVLTLEI